MNEEFVAGQPASLAELMTLQDMGGDRFLSRCNESNRGGEVFGGQYLGQSVIAALATASDYAPQALFAFFLRAARGDQPLEFNVERTRQGRRFAHRRVTVCQSGQEVFRAEIALHRPEDGQPSHAQAMPQVPGPETCRTMLELVREHADLFGPDVIERVEGNETSEFRPVNPEIGFGRAGDEPALRYWIRGFLPVGAAPALQYATLAYLSDNLAHLASRILHTTNTWSVDVTSLSLNHTISFHALPRIEDWLLFDLGSPFAGGGVGTGRNLIFGADGRLIASVTQDALVRYIRSD